MPERVAPRRIAASNPKLLLNHILHPLIERDDLGVIPRQKLRSDDMSEPFLRIKLEIRVR